MKSRGGVNNNFNQSTVKDVMGAEPTKVCNNPFLVSHHPSCPLSKTGTEANQRVEN